MSLATLFTLCNGLAMVAWAGILIGPTHPLARRGALGAVGVFCGIYAYLLAAYTGTGGFGSLMQVQAIFLTPAHALAGWLHYLAFDLLVGLYEARRCAERGIPWWVRVPVMVCTFFLGPIGFALFALACFRWRNEA